MLNFRDVSASPKKDLGDFSHSFPILQIPDPTDPGGSTETLGAKFGGVSEGGGRMWSAVLDDYTMDKNTHL